MKINSNLTQDGEIGCSGRVEIARATSIVNTLSESGVLCWPNSQIKYWKCIRHVMHFVSEFVDMVRIKFKELHEGS